MFVAHSGDGGAGWSPPVFATGDREMPQQLLLGRNTGHSDRLFLAVDPSLDVTAKVIERLKSPK